jgi:hypothetical protein
MLEEHREFPPYAAALTVEGELQLVGDYAGDAPSSSAERVSHLMDDLRQGAGRGEYLATGLVADVTTTPPGSSDRTDAIRLSLEHREGGSVEVFLPYTIDEEGQVTYEESFAAPGQRQVFPEEPETG